jgi:branched-chain amino acid transport system permease protein
MYSKIMQQLKSPQRLSIVLAGVLIMLLPLFVQEAYFLHLMILSMIFGAVSASWNITMGYCGLFNFGHMTFFGIAAYTSAILSKTFGMSPWITMLVAALVAVIASLIIGLPTLRLEGVYVAMFSLAFMQVIGWLFLYDPFNVTRGSKGIPLLPTLSIGPINFGVLNKIPNYYYAFLLLVVTIFCLYKLVNSSTGYALKAIRDNKNYAISRGINPYKYKIIAWVASAFFTGLAGAFYAHYNTVVSLEIFSFSLVSLVLAQLVVGGLGTTIGPVIGSFFMTFISEELRGLSGYRFLFIALAIILIVHFARGGLYTLVTRMFEKVAQAAKEG